MKVIDIVEEDVTCLQCGAPLTGKKGVQIIDSEALNVLLCKECVMKQYRVRMKEWNEVLLALNNRDPAFPFQGYDQHGHRILYYLSEEDAQLALKDDFGIDRPLTDKELQKIQHEIERSMEFSWHEIIIDAVREATDEEET